MKIPIDFNSIHTANIHKMLRLFLLVEIICSKYPLLTHIKESPHQLNIITFVTIYKVSINSLERRNQIHQELRKSRLQAYFRSRRIQMIQSRKRLFPRHNSTCIDDSSIKQQSWKILVLKGISITQRQCYQASSKENYNNEVEFDVNISSIETAEYYLNFIIQGAVQNHLEQTIGLLAKLISKVLNLKSSEGMTLEQSANLLVSKIMKQIHYYLKMGIQIVNQNGQQTFQKNKNINRMLSNLFQDQYRILLIKQDPKITTQLINIEYQLCRNFMVYPNYHLIKHITTRLVSNQNLTNRDCIRSRQQIVDQSPNLGEKIQQLLMKFIIFFRTEEKANYKHKNIHHMQIIHEFHNFVEFNLTNIFQFVRNNEHPFDYQHINNNLYFILTLYSEIIKKFKDSLKSIDWDSPAPIILIKPSIIDIIYNLVYIHSKSFIAQRREDQFILSIEETVSMILFYVIDFRRDPKHEIKNHYNPWAEWQVGHNDDYLLDVLMIIKKRLKELEE